MQLSSFVFTFLILTLAAVFAESEQQVAGGPINFNDAQTEQRVQVTPNRAPAGNVPTASSDFDVQSRFLFHHKKPTYVVNEYYYVDRRPSYDSGRGWGSTNQYNRGHHGGSGWGWGNNNGGYGGYRGGGDFYRSG